jgi:hypothetical protein
MVAFSSRRWVRPIAAAQLITRIRTVSLIRVRSILLSRIVGSLARAVQDLSN